MPPARIAQIDCPYQLSNYYPQSELTSVINQLGKRPYEVKERRGKFAVFTTGKRVVSPMVFEARRRAI